MLRIERDPTLADLADLPLGWQARRELAGEPWVRGPSPPEEDE